jgi:hypothetical protein
MSLYNTFTDWLSTKYISDDELAWREQVAADQQAAIDRQYGEGRRDLFEYLDLSSQVEDAGNMEKDYIAEKGSFGSVIWAAFGTVPFWAWILAALALAWYLGAFSRLKGVLAK